MKPAPGLEITTRQTCHPEITHSAKHVIPKSPKAGLNMSSRNHSRGPQRVGNGSSAAGHVVRCRPLRLQLETSQGVTFRGVARSQEAEKHDDGDDVTSHPAQSQTETRQIEGVGRTQFDDLGCARVARAILNVLNS